MNQTLTIGNGKLGKDIAKIWSKEVEERQRNRTAAILNRVAFAVRKEEKKQLRKDLRSPIKQTVDSVVVDREPGNRPIDDMESKVGFLEFANDYLAANVTGEVQTERHGISPVLIPNIPAFRRAPVRRELGKLVNRFGNIDGLKDGKVFEKILKNPNVFEVRYGTPSRGPGIYFRFRKGTFTLFYWEEQVTKKPILEFTEAALRGYRQNIKEIVRKSS